MGSVFVRSISNALTGFVGRVLGLESGTFTLATGEHQIEIDLNMSCPESIWIKFDNVGFDGCGQAKTNKVGYVINDNKIFFDVDVKTETCEVHWFAVN